MTNLAVISHEFDIEDEAELVNRLFKEGLQLFHLKKPVWNEDAHLFFMDSIDPVFHDRISFHQHRELAAQYGLKYMHVKETERKKGHFTAEKNLLKSTSFHDYNEMKENDGKWDYCFLSPVFDSISKKNYSGNFSGLVIGSGFKTKVFALGGITAENIAPVFERGFYGAAISGALWADPAKAIDTFRKIQARCNSSVHTF